ncbi:hypothetical protein FG386_002846 [Cryptosporidium ryanae]|uniref:uncharacterized protein n=1 Tax=Cryptosporidium ryanae TaxID=515981 RepID=UPI00351A0ED0|nr:hypothetical protein FG386_002846 [Cryptosporidium ryanae]
MYHVQYTVGGLPIYDFSRGKSLPEYLEDSKKQKKSPKNESEYKNRVEILQNFDFTVASSRIRVSQDGQYVAGTGTYPPELRMFDTKELSMKFMRRFDFEVHDFLFLSEDYKKLVFLMTDRVIEFHSQGGRHCRVRVPKQGRSMEYLNSAAELFIFGSTNEAYRLDLESGMFLAPLNTELEYINTGKVSPTLPLLLVGGDHGKIELWDLRDRSMAASLKVNDLSSNSRNGLSASDTVGFSEPSGTRSNKDSKFAWFDANAQNEVFVTTSCFSRDGLRFSLGLSSGSVLIYDVRSNKPLEIKSHKSDLPIMDMHYTYCQNTGKDVLITSDKQTIKIWNELKDYGDNNRNNGGLMGTITTDFPISSICTYPNSGLIMSTGDKSRIGMYFAPVLGVAPKWCSFLDSITEELEEDHLKRDQTSPSSSGIYDDYQFVTAEQLKEWGVEHLIGSSFLKAYLHGYLMNSRMFSDLRDLLNPFDYEKYRKERARRKMEEKSPMRIPVKINNNKQPVSGNTKVNLKFADRLKKQAKGELVSSEEEDGEEQPFNKGKQDKKSKRTLEKRKRQKEKLKKGQQERAISLLSDDRFSKLFSDADYIIDDKQEEDA